MSCGALSFDGINDEATIDHYSGFENLEELTISIWLNPSEYPSAYATCGGGYGAVYALVSKWASTIASRTFEITCLTGVQEALASTQTGIFKYATIRVESLVAFSPRHTLLSRSTTGLIWP